MESGSSSRGSSSFAVSIRLHASIAPSEDPEKVLKAARNVLGECSYSVETRGGAGTEGDGGSSTGRVEAWVTLSSTDTHCLQRIHDQLRDRHVRDAARRLLLRGRRDSRLTLLLNRQAAFVGVVVVCNSVLESPLGPMVLEIDCDRAEGLIDWLTAHS
jgi:predicted RNA binding protein with dsRBD fold (UPF0201 family)